MKTFKAIYKTLSLSIVLGLAYGCTEEEIEPTLSVTATPTTVNAGETVTFDISGNAETFVIFTGDDGHKYENSYLALSEGKDVDLELVVLTQDSLDKLLPWLEPQVEFFNTQAPGNDQNPLVFSEVQAALTALVGVEFNYYEAARYKIATEILPGMEMVAVNLVNAYFEDRSTVLAPDGGYDKGVALNRYNLAYTYVYNTPGEYTVTVIATTVSNKNYSRLGYKKNRSTSSNEYEISRVIREVVITVQ